MARIGEEVGHLDFLVHALAYAPREALDGMYADTKREDFRIALDVSAYSLVAVARAALPLMKDRQAAIVTLTYLGAERVFQNYNVMGVAKAALEASVRYLANDLGPHGIRVNAISAGPIKTLASSAVGGISNMIKLHLFFFMPETCAFLNVRRSRSLAHVKPERRALHSPVPYLPI